MRNVRGTYRLLQRETYKPMWRPTWNKCKNTKMPFSHQVAVLPLVAGRPLPRPVPKLQWLARPTKLAGFG